MSAIFIPEPANFILKAKENKLEVVIKTGRDAWTEEKEKSF